MKQINLRSKKFPELFTIVDDDVFDKVNEHKWCVLDSNRKE